MKNIKRFASLILILSLLTGVFAACSPSDKNPSGETDNSGNIIETGEKGEKKDLTLCYAKSDSLNPFFAKSQTNQMLSALFADPLFRTDEKFSSVPVIAKDIKIEGNKAEVNIGSAQFSDGSFVTAGDVKYSFDMAKKSPAYAGLLYNVTSAYASGTKVVFSLASPDKYVSGVLSFPIVKSGTANDDKAFPVGSGRYKLDGTQQNPHFSANPKNAKVVNAYYQTISLINLPDSDALINSLQIGNTDFIFDDLSSGKYKRINAEVREVSLNNMVFLGVNSANKLLQNDLVKQAVSLSLDRKLIASSAYQGHAVPSSLPFHPLWAELKSAGINPNTEFKADEAEKLLKEAGLTEKNNRKILLFNKKPVSLKLIVNAGNPFRNEAAALIAEQLTKIGIETKVSVLSNENYIAAINKGQYDLYLGEIKLSDNMDLNPLLKKGGAAFYGVREDNPAVASYAQMRKGETALSGFAETFSSSLPFIPVCFKNGVSAYNREIKSEVKSLDSDKFYNIEQWR